MQKIYFVEKSIPFNANDLNLSLVGGIEKILINISNELGEFPEKNMLKNNWLRPLLGSVPGPADGRLHARSCEQARTPPPTHPTQTDHFR